MLGIGAIGKKLAARLAGLGHEGIVGTRHKRETIARSENARYGYRPIGAWHKGHLEVQLGTFGEAAAHGEMVVNATAGAVSLEALDMAGEGNLTGKILIDISNPLDFSKGMPPRSGS